MPDTWVHVGEPGVFGRWVLVLMPGFPERPGILYDGIRVCPMGKGGSYAADMQDQAHEPVTPVRLRAVFILLS